MYHKIETLIRQIKEPNAPLPDDRRSMILLDSIREQMEARGNLDACVLISKIKLEWLGGMILVQSPTLIDDLRQLKEECRKQDINKEK